MTDGRRRHAVIIAELAGLRIWLAEIRAGAMRRASQLSRRRDEFRSGRARAALSVIARDVLGVSEAAEAALSGLEGDLNELVGRDEPDRPEK